MQEISVGDERKTVKEIKYRTKKKGEKDSEAAN